MWRAPDVTTTYKIVGADGRQMTIVLQPSHETLFLYEDPGEGSVELVLAHLRGTFGTHWVGSLWNVDDEGSWFGLRWYPRPIEPVIMEVQVLDKNRSGRGESSFQRIGSRARSIILFTPDSLRFSDMWFPRVPTDPTLVRTLTARVRSTPR